MGISTEPLGAFWTSAPRQQPTRAQMGHMGHPTSPRTQVLCCLISLNSCLPPDEDSPADIFAVGFEEMVELSAGNIVNAR